MLKCVSVDLTTRRNQNRRRTTWRKVNSVSSRHRVIYEKRIHERIPRGSGKRYATHTGYDSIETNIDPDDDDTRMRLIAKRVRMYHRSNRSSMLLSRVKLDPRLSRSVYGSRTVHGLCIAYIDHAIVHVDVNYCCFYRYSDDKQRHVIGLIYANL